MPETPTEPLIPLGTITKLMAECDVTEEELSTLSESSTKLTIANKAKIQFLTDQLFRRQRYPAEQLPHLTAVRLMAFLNLLYIKAPS